MTTAITKITVNEYKCERCGYKWVNRRNGKDRPIPKKCAKCKRDNWDGPKYSPKERGLRNRIRFLKQLYPDLPDRLIDRFLDIRPTITELRKVLYSTRLKLTSRNQYSYIRTLSRDLLKQDALRQQEIMENIIKSRSQ
jgi:hypothetical protein